MTSRLSTLLLIALLAAAPVCAVSTHAYADDDGERGGGERGGGERGGGDDDNEQDGGRGTGGSSSGSGQSSQSSNRNNDSDDVQNVVQSGKAVSLSNLLNYVNTTYPGTVINVDLKKEPDGYTYRVKLLTEDNKLRIVDLDAQQLKEQNTASIY